MSKNSICHICFTEGSGKMFAVKIEKLDEYVFICEACKIDLSQALNFEIDVN